MVLDTSIWLEYFHRGNREVARLLDRGQVQTHPLVVGELACGSFEGLREKFALLGKLPSVLIVEHVEAIALLERHDLAGRGIGWIDLHLLASARLSGSPIWTRDRHLAAAARKVNVELKYG